MTNPVDTFLLEKKALNLRGMAQAAGPRLRQAGSSAATGALTAGGALGAAALAGAAGKLYDAATKTRDFNRMLEANPHLQEHLQDDPAHFNRLYTSLRTLAPDFAREPMVAGSYMFNALNMGREQAGMVAVDAQSKVRSRPQGPLTEAAMGGFMKGFSAPTDGGKKPNLTRQTRSVFRPGDGGGEPALDRIEDTQNYYG